MAENQIKKIMGKDVIVAVRPKHLANQMNAVILPWQTGSDYDPSKDSDTTATKDGSVSVDGQLETDFGVAVIDSDHVAVEILEDSLYNGTMLEIWRIKLGKRDTQNRAYSIYALGKVSEMDESADADDLSTIDVSFAIDGTPKRGYLTVPENVQAAIDYAFKGLKNQTEYPSGDGIAYDTSELDNKLTSNSTSNSNSEN